MKFSYAWTHFIKNTTKKYFRIDPSLRSAAYCTGLRFGDSDDYDFLWNRMTTTNIANEARIIGDILGCSSDKNKLNRYFFKQFLYKNLWFYKQNLWFYFMFLKTYDFTLCFYLIIIIVNCDLLRWENFKEFILRMAKKISPTFLLILYFLLVISAARMGTGSILATLKFKKKHC